MAFEQYLNDKIQNAIKTNDQMVLYAATNRDSDLLYSINAFRANKMMECEHVSTDDILRRIQEDVLIRAMFRKDTTRQSIHEKAQISWIQRTYPNAIKLNNGAGGLCLSNNKLVAVGKIRPPDATKTIDLADVQENRYFVLKYTGCTGGAQDNQYNDVKQFIRQAVGYHLDSANSIKIFMFYLNGPYYTEKKRNELRDMIPDTMKVFILITLCE